MKSGVSKEQEEGFISKKRRANMQCFNGNPETKRRIMQRAHEAGTRAAQGEDRKTIFWSRRSWCRSTLCVQQAQLATILSTPAKSAYRLPSLTPNTDSSRKCPIALPAKWPERYLDALSITIDGALLNQVWRDLALFVLADETNGLLNMARSPEQNDAIVAIVELFESGSEDADAWKQAARNARQVSHDGPDTNYRLESAPAFLAAGAKACYAASYFASAFENPRYAAEALSWSAWAFRYRKYAQLMAGVRKGSPPADEHGMVDFITSLDYYSDWTEQANHSEREGERIRKAMYDVYADQLIHLIKRCVRQNRPASWRRHPL